MAEPIFPHPDGLAAAKAHATPGLCIFCEEKVCPGRKLLCRSADCQSAYYRAWHRDALVMHPERYQHGYVPPGVRLMHEAWLAKVAAHA